MKDRSNKYMNPYLAGVLIGLMMIAAYYFSGEGLGGSGAFKKITIAAVNSVAPGYAHEAAYFAPSVENGKSPLNSWLVFEVIGVMMGALLSAAYFGRLTLKMGKSPKVSNRTRIYAAIAGGILWGVGSQLGRGCTSGLIMSGMAVNALSGYIRLAAVFGGGYLFAYFFRKLWI
jgi:hypothetical protein